MAVNTTPQPNIEQARDLLSPYLDGEVTPAERRLVEETLAISPELRADLEALRHIITLMAALPPVPAPRPFTLTEADARRVKPTPRRGWFSLPSLRPWVSGLAAVAAVLVCVLAVGGLLFRGVSAPGQPQQAAYAPAAEKPAAQQAKATEAPKAEAQPIQKTVEAAKEAAALAPTTAAMPAAAPVEPPPEAAKAAEKPAEKRDEGKQAAEVEKQVEVTATPAAALPAAAVEAPVPSAAGAGPAGQADQGMVENITEVPPLATGEISDTVPTTLEMVALPTELTEEPPQTAGAAASDTTVTAPVQPPEPELLLDKSQPEATPAPQREIPPAPIIATRELAVISPTPPPTASPVGETQPPPTLTPTLPQAEITPPAGSGWIIGLAVGAAVMAGLVGWALMRRRRKKRQ